MKKVEFELRNILEKHDGILKEKFKDVITHSYFDALQEIEVKKLSIKDGITNPRMDYFLQSMFFYIFSKLHKGDKLKAYEIMKELQDKVVRI